MHPRPGSRSPVAGPRAAGTSSQVCHGVKAAARSPRERRLPHRFAFNLFVFLFGGIPSSRSRPRSESAARSAGVNLRSFAGSDGAGAGAGAGALAADGDGDGVGELGSCEADSRRCCVVGLEALERFLLKLCCCCRFPFYCFRFLVFFLFLFLGFSGRRCPKQPATILFGNHFGLHVSCSLSLPGCTLP